MQQQQLGLLAKLEFGEYWLKEHPDQQHVNIVMDYIKNGINFGFKGERDKSVIYGNWKSASKFQDEVSQFISANVDKGHIDGPFQEAELPYNFRASPFGAFKKVKSSRVKVRPIHDLSWETGNSVNAGINKDEYSVSYTSINQVVDIKCQIPPYQPVYLCKIDLEAAYMACAVCKNDRHLLGF